MNVSTRAIADAIGADPVLAARVLRAANSPLYSLERRVTALPAAVNALGNNAINLLVVIYAASDTFSSKKRQSPLERTLWEHSVAVGVAARELSLTLGMRGSEESFLCGLLHDIGKLLLLRHNSGHYAQMEGVQNEQEMLTREQEIYGYTHAQIGALVARRWSLPEDIGYAINYHHHPSEAEQFMLMARVIDVADGLANKAGIGMRPEPERDLSISESVLALNLTTEQLTGVWERAQVTLGEMMTLFN
jgi:putative nucleotidyltransferase with HDIG domain